MIPDPDDTIVALASAPGPGTRGIVRLSGSAVAGVVAAVFNPFPDPLPAKRKVLRGRVRFPGIHSSLPADLYYSPAPHTYTGQDTAELHTVSSPPLLEALVTALMNAGARSAQPGEFTLRAFLAGKKDLPQAEAVAAVVAANTPDELQHALGQLAGGVTQPLQGLREDLLNLLADVEAGLDFTDENIEFVGTKDILLRLGKGLAQLTNLLKQIEDRSLSGRPFRVALVGAPNAGKSSLFNALAGRPAALVSSVPGTTRDYVTRTITFDGLAVELIDTAGMQNASDTIEEQAQALGSALAKAADLLLWCVEAGRPAEAPSRSRSRPTAVAELDSGDFGYGEAGQSAVRVATKCDLAEPPPHALATSAVTGAGLPELRELLAGRARAFARPALAPSLSRCRHHVEDALKHLRAAHAIVLFDDPAELLALELRLVLEQLGEMVGAVYTDDLLDRIFSRFCIGK